MRGPSRGVVLITVLWLITILALVAVALAGYLSTETRLARYRLARAQARAWAQGGVWLGVQRLAHDSRSTDPSTRLSASLRIVPSEPRESRDDEGYDWLGDDWSYVGTDPARPLAWRVAVPLQRAAAAFQGQVTIHITDEERRLSTQASDALRQDPAMSAEDAAVVREETSPHLAAESTLNINTADERLLQALFQTAGRPWLAEQLVAYRWDPEDGTAAENGSRFSRLTPEVETVGAPLNPGIKEALTQVMAGPLGGLLGVRSEHFTITAVAEIGQPAVRYRVAAVVRRSVAATTGHDATGAVRISGVTFQVLAWRAD